ncbi:hypothetical protein BOX15_Mlig008794g1 [Macrostomum lignano]|uniref:Integrase catalytic domain-containing protein n=1 Tax=Macrostomum lignano TaxID=282301 RepID=A0A267FK39_9PLAT|nr:hypothetical protein BOX15_Mlig008794g1 [Macrostomum lignano]
MADLLSWKWTPEPPCPLYPRRPTGPCSTPSQHCSLRPCSCEHTPVRKCQLKAASALLWKLLKHRPSHSASLWSPAADPTCSEETGCPSCGSTGDQSSRWQLLLRCRPDCSSCSTSTAMFFSPELGKYNGPPVSLNMKPDAQPRFMKARNLPFALKDKVESQLNREIEQGILVPVQHSEYASPVVPVLKSDGSVRVCADFKQTVNPNVEPDSYPLPRIEELFAKLTGGRLFTKLDLSQAYMQLPLDEASQTRLPFGVSPAVGIFQRRMDCLLQGITSTACFIDDLIITGKDDSSHLNSLEQVLEKLSQSGLRCKLEKCQFMQTSISYLGHRIDADGLHPIKDKVEAIVSAPAPKDATQLRSFLGMVNYYGKFLPNLSQILAPLHLLLREQHRWNWGAAQNSAFEKCKALLSSAPVLAHFDPSEDLLLECDASPYGLGAVISHRIDGAVRPVAFASRTLHDAEKNYSQLEKEALAVVFAVKKFNAYLFGRPFLLVSDHKPLLGLLAENKAVPALASGGIQRWALLLSGYNYRMVHRAGASLLCADALSRLPLPGKPATVPKLAELVMLMDHLDDGPVTAAQIRGLTRRDPTLARALHFTQIGWPERVSDDLLPYSKRAAELSVQDGCLLWGARVVVPVGARAALLQVLHQGHAGASRMKTLARGYFWWPGLDSEIENLAKACSDCQELQNAPAPSPMLSWPWPDRPWSRVHIDYAGPVSGKMLLVVVDAHSKWLDVHVVTSATSAVTIQKLRSSFATHGLPDVLVSDNGPNLVSEEMSDFLQKNGIQHVRVAPYHPASNGLAERAVQTLKRSLEKQREDSLEDKVARFLLSYRVTPHATTGVAPCELLMGRHLCTLLDRARPDLGARVQRKQNQQKEHHDCKARFRTFETGDAVLARDFGANGGRWKPARVVGATGPTSYLCGFDGDDRVVRRHVDHVRGGPEQPRPTGAGVTDGATDAKAAPEPEAAMPAVDEPPNLAAPGDPEIDGSLRRSSRVRRPPERLSYG